MSVISFDMAVHDTETNRYLGVCTIVPAEGREDEYVDALRTLGYEPHLEPVESVPDP